MWRMLGGRGGNAGAEDNHVDLGILDGNQSVGAGNLRGTSHGITALTRAPTLDAAACPESVCLLGLYLRGR